MADSYTPMLEQYREIKNRHLNDILFFRLGDFYEMFFEDAQTASRRRWRQKGPYVWSSLSRSRLIYCQIN
jgi:hypothetical protein